MDAGRDVRMATRRRIQGEIGFKELEVVAYVGDFKIVGFAHFGVGPA